MHSGKNIVGWVYVMALAGITVKNVIAEIQYNKITKILNKMNNTSTNKEGS